MLLALALCWGCTGTKDVGAGATELDDLTVDGAGRTDSAASTPVSSGTVDTSAGATGATGVRDSTPQGDSPHTGSWGCGTDAPELSGLVAVPVVDTDPSTPEASPGVRFELTASDADGGLHRFEVRYWADRSVDGVVDRQRAPAVSVIDTTADACTVTQLPWSFTVGFADGHGAFAEVALQIVDADGVASNVVQGSGCVPRPDGSLCP